MCRQTEVKYFMSHKFFPNFFLLITGLDWIWKQRHHFAIEAVKWSLISMIKQSDFMNLTLQLQLLNKLNVILLLSTFNLSKIQLQFGLLINGTMAHSHLPYFVTGAMAQWWEGLLAEQENPGSISALLKRFPFLYQVVEKKSVHSINKRGVQNYIDEASFQWICCLFQITWRRKRPQNTILIMNEDSSRTFKGEEDFKSRSLQMVWGDLKINWFNAGVL